ncbi:MAG: Transcriptional adapter ada2 [Chaenotheca gracillima]|nr:MAG: Transcriptional adapter ada2 [Chaenotheca gracillima]
MNIVGYKKVLHATGRCAVCRRPFHGAITSLAAGRNSRQTNKEELTKQGRPKRGPSKKSTIAEHKGSVEDKLVASLSQSRLKADKSRINVVNPELCNDIIERLTPSLKRHENCDILEVNPGVGLWSSKIHEQLKPRTHILMEPDERLYLPFLKPLLDKPGSHYRHLPWSGTDWESYQRLIEEGILSHQQVLNYGDPLQNRRNDSLLFLANFAHHPAKSMMGFSSVTFQMFNQLMSAIRTHSLFQAYGLVRMLVWVTDREKSTILPRTIVDRRRFGIDVEGNCEYVTEVAGGEGSGGRSRREKLIELESAVNVSREMRAQRTTTPESRKSELQMEADSVLSSHPENDWTPTLSKRTTAYVWDAELKDLKQRRESGDLPAYIHDQPGVPKSGSKSKSKKGGSSSKVRNPEYDRLIELRSKRRAYDRTAVTLEELLSVSSHISQVVREASDSTLSQDEARGQTWQEQLAELRAKQASLFSTLYSEDRRKLLHYGDDRSAYNEKPYPVLLHDRRPYHPLLTLPGDFSTREQGMSLLDVQPAPPSAAMLGNPKVHDTFELLVRWLFNRRARPFAKVLESLAPGAVEALVPQVPALRDRLRQDELEATTNTASSSSAARTRASKENGSELEDDVEDEDFEEAAGDDDDGAIPGSAKAINKFRCRMLTPEMLEGLAVAWEKWLFRPTAADLYQKVDAKYDAAEYRRSLYGDTDDIFGQ